MAEIETDESFKQQMQRERERENGKEGRSGVRERKTDKQQWQEEDMSDVAQKV